MKRVEREHTYWNAAAQDKDVAVKYISDISTEECFDGLQKGLPELVGVKVADLGCGIGRIAIPFAEMHPSCEMTGIDISDEMLNIAKQQDNSFLVRWIQNNGRNIPGGKYDVIYSMLMLQHIDKAGVWAYIRTISRALADNGLFRFQFIEGSEREPFSHHYFFTDVEQRLSECNFVITHYDQGLVHPQWSWITAEKRS